LFYVLELKLILFGEAATDNKRFTVTISHNSAHSMYE